MRSVKILAYLYASQVALGEAPANRLIRVGGMVVPGIKNVAKEIFLFALK